MLDGGFELAGQSVKQSRIQLFTAILMSNNLVESWINSFPVKAHLARSHLVLELNVSAHLFGCIDT